MRFHFVGLLVSALLVSCAARQPGVQAASVVETTVPAAPVSVLVYGNTGVLEVTLAGEIVRRIFPEGVTAAVRHGDHVFALVGGEHVTFDFDGGEWITPVELVRVDIVDGSADRLATLGAPMGFDCVPEGRHLERLGVHSDLDLRVDATGESVCVRRQDRNLNMMQMAVDERVWLTDGRVEARVVHCFEPREVPFDCGAPRVLPSQAPTRVHGHRVEEGHIVAPDGSRRPIAGGFEEERASASGNWVLLSAVTAEGDYIQRALLLLDRRSGSVHPFGSYSDGAALPDSALTDSATLLGGMTVPGEAFIRFVTWGGAEYLVINQALVTPGGRTSHLMGTPIL